MDLVIHFQRLCSLYLNCATIVRTNNFYYSEGPSECSNVSGDMLLMWWHNLYFLIGAGITDLL